MPATDPRRGARPAASRDADSRTGLAEDMAAMREAAREAGHLALSFKRQGNIDFWEKSKGHPVTEADLAVNTLLARRLGAARPRYGWLSEETVDDPENRKPDRVWVVDPIDGTRAYIAGTSDWCVGLAVVDRGEAVAGVIYVPESDELFEARCGGGAFRNGEPISATGCGEVEGCRMLASQQLIDHPGWATPWPALDLAKPNATLLRLARVAEGHHDATMAMWHKSDWDLAAGAIILEEAGGRATTHLGEAYCFNRTVPAQSSLVAAGKDLHPLLIGRTKSVPIPDPQTPDRKPRGR